MIDCRATPTPSSVQVDKRVPADVTVNTPPQNTITCAGVKTWDSAYMQEAIRHATDFKAQGLLQGNPLPSCPFRCWDLRSTGFWSGDRSARINFIGERDMPRPDLSELTYAQEKMTTRMSSITDRNNTSTVLEPSHRLFSPTVQAASSWNFRW